MIPPRPFRYAAIIDTIVISDSENDTVHSKNPRYPMNRLYEVIAPTLAVAARRNQIKISYMDVDDAVSAFPRRGFFLGGIRKFTLDPNDHRYDVGAMIVFETNLVGWDAASAWLYEAIAALTLPNDVEIMSVQQDQSSQN